MSPNPHTLIARYGYFYVRLYPTMLGLLQCNLVEFYVALCAALHVMVALKRTWDINRNYSIVSGKLNLALTGVVLLSFMLVHLVQFRFGDTQPYCSRLFSFTSFNQEAANLLA